SLLWKSEDGGGSFDLLRCNQVIENATCSPTGGAGAVATGTPQPPAHPPFPVQPPALYFSDVSPAGNVGCAYSYNGGNSINLSGPAFAQPAGLGQACGINANSRSVPTGYRRPQMAVYGGHGSSPIDTVYALYQSST